MHQRPRRPGFHEARMTRAELFERVWTTPVAVLAKEWGLSGPGLAKASGASRPPFRLAVIGPSWKRDGSRADPSSRPFLPDRPKRL